MAKSADRRASAEKQFKSNNLDVEFVQAFDAKTKGVKHSSKSVFTEGMIGCHISHERLIEEISRRTDIDIAVIFEDDIKIESWSFDPLSIPDDWDIAFLSWYSSGKFRTESVNENWLSLHEGWPWGFHNYAIKQKSAKKILDVISVIDGQVDVEVIKGSKEGKIKAYYAKKLHSQQIGIFETTVQPTNVKHPMIKPIWKNPKSI